MPKKQKNQKKSKKLYGGLKLFLTVIIVALLTFGILTLMKYLSDEKRQIDNQEDKNTASIYEESEKEKTNDEISDDGYRAKEEAEKQENNGNTTTNPDGKKNADVIISSAGLLNDKVIAGGMVSGVIEQDGDCTYTFSNGNTIITETSSAIANANNTICASVNLDKTRFIKGEWQVILKYSSEKTEGQSEATTFQIN